jgi:methionyl-tRNA formyltransferase
MGTPEVAAVILRSLLKKYTFEAVVTQPDRPKGRGLVLTPSPVKTVALEHGIEVLQPLKVKEPAFLKRIREIQPDLAVVVAYGGFLSREMIVIPARGCVNLHSSLLPKYRGATPVQWAVMRGEEKTGWSTFYINEGMDTGDIILQNEIGIYPEENAEELFHRMLPLGIDILLNTIDLIAEGTAPRKPQESSLASNAPKLEKMDGLISWQDTPENIVNKIRGLIPWPVAFTFLPWKEKKLELRIFKARISSKRGDTPGQVLGLDTEGLRVAARDASICIAEVQLEGGRRMSIHEFVRGRPIPPHTLLG